jgi:hypothetical protein
MSSGQRLRRSTGWAGWIAFAGMLMVLNGVFNVIDGLSAVFADDVFVRGDQGTVVLNLTTWGWVHIFWGLVVAFAGVALFSSKLWARMVAIVAVMINAATQALFLPAYPAWSVLIITADVFVLWALVVHGDEEVRML